MQNWKERFWWEPWKWDEDKYQEYGSSSSQNWKKGCEWEMMTLGQSSRKWIASSTHGNFPDFKRSWTGDWLYWTLPFVELRTGISSDVCRISGGPVCAILRVSLDCEPLRTDLGNGLYELPYLLLTCKSLVTWSEPDLRCALGFVWLLCRSINHFPKSVAEAMMMLITTGQWVGGKENCGKSRNLGQKSRRNCFSKYNSDILGITWDAGGESYSL